jgi:hypothetical protein
VAHPKQIIRDERDATVSKIEIARRREIFMDIRKDVFMTANTLRSSNVKVAALPRLLLTSHAIRERSRAMYTVNCRNIMRTLPRDN